MSYFYPNSPEEDSEGICECLFESLEKGGIQIFDSEELSSYLLQFTKGELKWLESLELKSGFGFYERGSAHLSILAGDYYLKFFIARDL